MIKIYLYVLSCYKTENNWSWKIANVLQLLMFGLNFNQKLVSRKSCFATLFLCGVLELTAAMLAYYVCSHISDVVTSLVTNFTFDLAWAFSSFVLWLTNCNQISQETVVRSLKWDAMCWVKNSWENSMPPPPIFYPPLFFSIYFDEGGKVLVLQLYLRCNNSPLLSNKEVKRQWTLF